MEWKFERSAGRKVKTDEEVLWGKIMLALGTDLRQSYKQSLRMLTKAYPGTKLPDGHTSHVENQEFQVTEV